MYRVFITEGLSQRLEAASRAVNVDVDFLASMCLAIGFHHLREHLNPRSNYESADENMNVTSGFSEIEKLSVSGDVKQDFTKLR